MVKGVSCATTVVLMENVPVVAPGGIGTSAGTCAALLLVDTTIAAPVAGATPLSVRVPVTVLPPEADGNVSVKDLKGELPRNGFATEKTSVVLFASFNARFAEVDEKAIVLPSADIVAGPLVPFPFEPSAATLKSVNEPIIRSCR